MDQLPQPVLARRISDRRHGTVRHIKFGEGDYNVTENLIRQLLTDAHPGVKFPPPGDSADTTPQGGD